MIDLSFKLPPRCGEGVTGADRGRRFGTGELGSEDAGVGLREEEGDSASERGGEIAVLFRDAIDETSETQAAKVVGHLCSGVSGGRGAELTAESADVLAKGLIRETVGSR